MAWIWRILLVIVLAIGGFVAWYKEARNLALLIDPIDRIRVYTKSVALVGWDNMYLTIGDSQMSLWTPATVDAFPLVVDANQRLVATINGKPFVLGVRHGLFPHTQQPTPAFTTEPGDTVTFTFERSWIIWPNWFETNWMTGVSPRWKRFVFYHLVWRKRSGETLDIKWRYERDWYPSRGRWLYWDLSEGLWSSADATGDNCGLMSARIL